MTDKKQLRIFFPVDFLVVIKDGQKILQKHQKEFDRFFLSIIPRPYSIGNEIAFRFIQYEKIKQSYEKTINKFVPDIDKQLIMCQLPKSPIEVLLQNGYRAYKNI